MSKLIKCNSCGAEIAKSAKFCPHCGAKKKPGCLRVALGTFLFIIGIGVIIGTLVGGNDKPSVSPSGNQTPESSNVTPTEASSFGIGDRVEMNDIYVTLDNVTENSGTDYIQPAEGNIFVICEFTIENESDSEIAISSVMSFTAYADDYAVQLSIGGMSQAGKQQLDGSIAAGKKMNGVVAYEVPADWSEIEVHFAPNVYSTKDFVFVHRNGNTAAGSSDMLLVDDDAIKVTFREVFEAEGITGAFYLRMNMENKTDKEVWVYLDSASVNGEMVTVMSGIPTIITPGNSSNNPYIFSFSNLSISELSEVEEIRFKIVVADNATNQTIYTSDFVTVSP